MKLSDHDREILAGADGEARRIAMEVVVKLGELYEAECLTLISMVHTDSTFYIGQGPLEFVEHLANNGGKVAVPTSTNALNIDLVRAGDTFIDDEMIGYNKRIEAAHKKLGVAMTCTCAPYHGSIMPRFGEIICSAESNVIAYYNSVIGARTNRTGGLLDICTAIVGKTPLFGMLLDENRKAKVILRTEGFSDQHWQDDATYPLLGYTFGSHVQDRIGVIDGVQPTMTVDQLKNFGAAVASSGSAALYHVAGVTPEARTLDECLADTVEDEYTIHPEMLEEARAKLWTSQQDDVDLVILGCPHLSYPELQQLEQLFAGRKVSASTEFWVFTNRAVHTWLIDSGLHEKLTEKGVKIYTDGCTLEYNQDHWQFKSLKTNSGKMANYCYAKLGIDIALDNLKGCVESGISGKGGKR